MAVSLCLLKAGYFCFMRNQYLLEIYYSLLESKSCEEMNVVLDWFLSGFNKEDSITKAEMKSYLTEHPILFTQSQVAQRSIYDKILLALN